MKKIFFIALILIFPTVNILSLLNCEVMTFLYGKDILNLEYIENIPIIENKYFRIISYNGSYAEIYEVNPQRGGFIWEYSKKNGEWILIRETPGCVWTNLGGNAAETIWPYWWHFIYWGGISA